MPSNTEEPYCMECERTWTLASSQRTNSPSRQIQSVAVSFVDIAISGVDDAGNLARTRSAREARRAGRVWSRSVAVGRGRSWAMRPVARALGFGGNKGLAGRANGNRPRLVQWRASLARQAAHAASAE